MTSGRGTTSVTRCVTTTLVAGMEVTARSTLMIRGKTAPRLFSAGVTSMMGSATASVTAPGVSTMDLIAKDKKDSASKSGRSFVLSLGLPVFFQNKLLHQNKLPAVHGSQT